MKFPFEFGTKLIFRLIIPGALLAAAMLPAVHGLLYALGFMIRVAYAYPFEAVAWGWAIVVCDQPIYMLFEGRRYWPSKLYGWMLDRETQRLQRLTAAIDLPDPNPEDEVEYALFPIDAGGDAYVEYPTRLGNLIESYETYPEIKYGLDAIFCWHRLWVVIDKDLREEVDNAQSVVDSALYITFALYIAGVMCFVYTIASFIINFPSLVYIRTAGLPAPLVLLFLGVSCLCLGYLLYRFSLPAHAQFGELFKALFDQYKEKLKFEGVLEQVGSLRGAPYVSPTQRQKNQIVWRYLRWHLIRDEKAQKNFKVKDWPRP